MGEDERMKKLTMQEWAERAGDTELAEIFAAVAGAAAQIAAKIRLAGLDDVYGAAGATNVQGEQQQKLDVFANEVMTAAMRACPVVVGVVSEEDEEPVVFPRDAAGPHFALSFDPLDGSSNIDVNVNVGTIFGVRRLASGEQDIAAAMLRPGTEQVAAGYVVYGPSVVFVLSAGDGVAAFTLDDRGQFLLSADRMRMPEQGIYYSANEASEKSWPAGFRGFIPALLHGELGGKPYGARYIGSLVADFHRTLLKGGVFLYPPSDKAPRGKLRLGYEANPLALIAEQAGGAASDGHGRILELRPGGIHERTGLVIGSRREVELLERLVREVL